MRTPAGKECKHFFGDYHRGRDHEECRLLENNPNSEPWRPEDCQTCPVPDILLQNACPHMKLTLTKTPKKFFGLFGGGLELEAWCSETFIDVKEPKVGCGFCHEHRGPSIFDLEEGPID